MRIPHILCTVSNFYVFLVFVFFRTSFEHPLSIMNLLKEYQIHMNSFFLFNIIEVENGEGAKNVRTPHILHTLSNFLVFLEFDIFAHNLNTH